LRQFLWVEVTVRLYQCNHAVALALQHSASAGCNFRSQVRRRLRDEGAPYMRELNALTDRMARPVALRIALPAATSPGDFAAGYPGFGSANT